MVSGSAFGPRRKVLSNQSDRSISKYMNAEHQSDSSPVESLHELTPSTNPPFVDEVTRVKLFLGIQGFFLVLSIFTGGFQFKLWSMLDSALLIQSIGITSLVLVLEEAKLRRLAFK